MVTGPSARVQREVIKRPCLMFGTLVRGCRVDRWSGYTRRGQPLGRAVVKHFIGRGHFTVIRIANLGTAVILKRSKLGSSGEAIVPLRSDEVKPVLPSDLPTRLYPDSDGAKRYPGRDRLPTNMDCLIHMTSSLPRWCFRAKQSRQAAHRFRRRRKALGSRPLIDDSLSLIVQKLNEVLPARTNPPPFHPKRL